jgi:hypothetical protein
MNANREWAEVKLRPLPVVFLKVAELPLKQFA